MIIFEMPGQNIPLAKNNMEEIKSSRTVTYRTQDGYLVTIHYEGRSTIVNIEVQPDFTIGDKASKKSE